MKTNSNSIGVSTSFYCHNGKGKWLLHKRTEKCRDERGVWDSGGGQMEFGLTLEENVLKEIREEYGCKAIIQEQLPTVTLLRRSPTGIQTHWIIVPFILLINTDDLKDVKIGDKEKMGEIGWFTFSSLPKPLHSGFQKTTKLYQSIFENYSSIS